MSATPAYWVFALRVMARYCAANVPQLVVTSAAKATVPFGFTVPLPGVTATESTFSAPTVTVAVAVLLGSAWLVATTW